MKLSDMASRFPYKHGLTEFPVPLNDEDESLRILNRRLCRNGQSQESSNVVRDIGHELARPTSSRLPRRGSLSESAGQRHISGSIAEIRGPGKPRSPRIFFAKRCSLVQHVIKHGGAVQIMLSFSLSIRAQQIMFALITGCSSGIGKELAIAFAARGVTVFATARCAESLYELTDRYDNIEAFSLEACNAASIDKLRDAVSDRTGGRLDFLVNNAGTHYASTAMDMEIGEVLELFQVNVFAVMRLCQVFIPFLRHSPCARIVQIGSVTRDLPVVWQSPYNASKAALSQYSKTLRLVS